MTKIHPYVEKTMTQLSNILYNGSQSATKNEILDSVKRMLKDYNDAGGNVRIYDFRDK